MALIRFSINNPLITNLLLGLVVIMGVLAWRSMPQEMFPTVEMDAVTVSVVFEGASPEEVERQISIPLEEEFEGMADIDVLTSTSNEGLATLMIKLKPMNRQLRDAESNCTQVMYGRCIATQSNLSWSTRQSTRR